MTIEQQPRSHFLAQPLGRRLLDEGEEGGDGDMLAMMRLMGVTEDSTTSFEV